MTPETAIAPALARALEKKGYAALTEVQSAVLAEGAAQADLLVSAQTGSGKTVAFGLTIAPTLLGEAESFDFAAEPLALVVAPTRELALQVQREFEWLFAEAYGRIASCVGGMDPRSERRALERGCHIVVGTPGRLRDHIERGALDMSGLRAVVLDEADEMLDFGFREDLEFILDAAPADRRTLLFSATVPKAIADIARRFQRDARRISTVSEREQHVDIEYRALTVAPRDREHAIINVLRYHDAERTIVFCRTRDEVNRLSSRLGNRGFAVVSLSGELSQNERTHALQAMRDGRARVCVATDVAARGIDLPGLELVIHADLPTNGDTLLHRSGRTGRAGRKGVCTLIVPFNLRHRTERLLRDARVTAQWGEAPGLADIEARDRERILEDPALSQSHDEAILEEARALLERHGAEQVAAAFIAHRRTMLPSAEELEPVFATGRTADAPREKRENFTGGRWFVLTAGRRQRAEPRWLLPLICRLGQVTKREVGSIQIGDSETRFEIAGAVADRFMAAVKEAGGGEKSIRIRPAGEDEGDAMPQPPAPLAEGEVRDRRPRPLETGKPGKSGKPRREAGFGGRPDRPARRRHAEADAGDAPDTAAADRAARWSPAAENVSGSDQPRPYGKSKTREQTGRPDAKPAKRDGAKGKPKRPGKANASGKPGAPGAESYPRRKPRDESSSETGATLKRVKRKPPSRDR